MAIFSLRALAEMTLDSLQFHSSPQSNCASDSYPSLSLISLRNRKSSPFDLNRNKPTPDPGEESALEHCTQWLCKAADINATPLASLGFDTSRGWQQQGDSATQQAVFAAFASLASATGEIVYVRRCRRMIESLNSWSETSNDSNFTYSPSASSVYTNSVDRLRALVTACKLFGLDYLEALVKESAIVQMPIKRLLAEEPCRLDELLSVAETAAALVGTVFITRDQKLLDTLITYFELLVVSLNQARQTSGISSPAAPLALGYSSLALAGGFRLTGTNRYLAEARRLSKMLVGKIKSESREFGQLATSNTVLLEAINPLAQSLALNIWEQKEKEDLENSIRFCLRSVRQSIIICEDRNLSGSLLASSAREDRTALRATKASALFIESQLAVKNNACGKRLILRPSPL